MGGMCLWLTRCVSYSLHPPRRSGSLRQLAQKTGSNRRSPSLLGCSSLREPRYGLPQAHPAHTLLSSFGVETSKKLGLPWGNPFFTRYFPLTLVLPARFAISLVLFLGLGLF